MNPNLHNNNRAVLNSLLDQTDRFLRVDRFSAAQQVLKSARQNPGLEIHHEFAQAEFLVREARIKLNLDDQAGALQCISLVTPEIRTRSAKIDASLHSTQGFLYRRHAFAAKSMGNIDLASQAMNNAIESFGDAVSAASFEGLEALSLNNQLNIVYSKGFIAHGNGASRLANSSLVQAAVCIEAELVWVTPPRDRSRFPGHTMIADLAVGAGLTPADVVCLQSPELTQSRSIPFAAACQSLGLDKGLSWPAMILEGVKLEGYKGAGYEPQFSKRLHVQALKLGGKLVAGMSFSFEKRQLWHAYLAHAERAMAEFKSAGDLRWHKDLQGIKNRLIAANGTGSLAPFALR